MKALKQLRILTAVGVAVLFAPPLFADLNVEINYQNLDLSYDTSGNLTVDQRPNSFASGFLKQNMAIIDSADIYNLSAGHWFDLAFSGVVTNGSGTDDIGIAALFKATDNVTTLAAPSLAANFVNANLLGDPDGVTFGSGILRIEGVISPHGGASSILLNPTSGNWVYQGGAVGTPVGADGVADQFTVDSLYRDNFDSGILAVLEVSLTHYGNGMPIGNVDADTLFATALSNGGFLSNSAQLQLAIVPVPGAALLGIIGLGTVARIKRRLAA